MVVLDAVAVALAFAPLTPFAFELALPPVPPVLADWARTARAPLTVVVEVAAPAAAAAPPPVEFPPAPPLAVS